MLDEESEKVVQININDFQPNPTSLVKKRKVEDENIKQEFSQENSLPNSQLKSSGFKKFY